jgi:hypothetical protein
MLDTSNRPRPFSSSFIYQPTIRRCMISLHKASLNKQRRKKQSHTVFWDITPCSPLSVNRRFVGTYRLHLQGRRICRAKKAAWKHLSNAYEHEAANASFPGYSAENIVTISSDMLNYGGSCLSRREPKPDVGLHLTSKCWLESSISSWMVLVLCTAWAYWQTVQELLQYEVRISNFLVQCYRECCSMDGPSFNELADMHLM